MQAIAVAAAAAAHGEWKGKRGGGGRADQPIENPVLFGRCVDRRRKEGSVEAGRRIKAEMEVAEGGDAAGDAETAIAVEEDETTSSPL